MHIQLSLLQLSHKSGNGFDILRLISSIYLFAAGPFDLSGEILFPPTQLIDCVLSGFYSVQRNSKSRADVSAVESRLLSAKEAHGPLKIQRMI